MRAWLVPVAAAAVLSACDLIRLEPPAADSAPAPSPVIATPDFRPFAGSTYADFASLPEFQEYSPAGLGLPAQDQARLSAAMAASAPAWIASGGGAQALLFTGCGAEGCDTARAVVAIDLATGAVFAGVRDASGATEFAPNPRLEALLRLSSPDRAWDNPQRGGEAPPQTP